MNKHYNDNDKPETRSVMLLTSEKHFLLLLTIRTGVYKTFNANFTLSLRILLKVCFV